MKALCSDTVELEVGSHVRVRPSGRISGRFSMHGEVTAVHDSGTQKTYDVHPLATINIAEIERRAPPPPPCATTDTLWPPSTLPHSARARDGWPPPRRGAGGALGGRVGDLQRPRRRGARHPCALYLH